MRVVEFLSLNRVCGRAVLAASVAAVAVGLVACGGGSGAAAPAPAPAPTPEVPQAAWALKPVTDAALVEQLRTALDASNSPKAALNFTVTVAASPSAGSAVADAAAAVSGTVLQEAGVDEADLVKSDGQSVFSVLPGSASAGGGDTVIERLTLPSSPATDPALKPVEKLASPLRNAATVQGLYLDAERSQLVVLGERGSTGPVADRWFSPMSWVGGGTELAVVGTAGALATRYTLGISAQLVGSRRVGSVLYLVLRSRAQPQGFDAGWATPVTTLDFAKAMIDEGYHPMTMYFPLVVHGAMLIEPTESESLASLELFIMTLRDLAFSVQRGETERFSGAPYHAPRRRLDETKAARNPVLKWTKPLPIEV